MYVERNVEDAANEWQFAAGQNSCEVVREMQILETRTDTNRGDLLFLYAAVRRILVGSVRSWQEACKLER